MVPNDIDSNLIKSPLDLNYIKYIKVHLNHLGSWPHEEFGGNPSRLRKAKTLLAFIFCFSIFYLGVEYIRQNSRDMTFFDIGHCYVNQFITLNAVQRLTMPLMSSYPKYLKELLTERHLFFYRNRSEYARQIFEKVNRWSVFFTKYLFYETYIAILFCQLGPLLNNVANDRFNPDRPENDTFYELPICMYVPIEYHKVGYSFMVILNVYMCYFTCAALISYDLMLFISIFTAWGHVKILRHELKNCPQPMMRDGKKHSISNPPWYSEEESEQISKFIKSKIIYYRMTKQFAVTSSHFFGFMFFFYIIIIQLGQIICLVQVSQMTADALQKFGLLTVMSFQFLTHLAVILEMLASESDCIKKSIYNMPWECMDTKNRKLLLIFLGDSQQSLSFKALGMIEIGVRTAASIIKTSCSYFLMLRTVALSSESK